MWSDYIYETRGMDAVENEHGFATFLIKDKECYVEDVYVKPESRKKYVASDFVNKIKDRAQRSGCLYLTTSVNMAITDPTASVAVILAYGFKITHTTNGFICFKLEI